MVTRSDIYIDQNVDYENEIDFHTIEQENYDIEECEFYASARKIYSSDIVFDFDTEVDIESNKIKLSLSAETSSYIKPGNYQYDLLMKSQDNKIHKALEGVVHILPTMTKIYN